MIYSLTGKVLDISPSEVVIECGGVGYLCGIPQTVAGALPPVGSTATIYTIMNVTENDVSLFGFATRAERETFRMLTSVSGVGPKVALAILSALPPDRVALAVSAGDHKAFTAANGVGPKLAQRLVLELRDKVSGLSVESGIAISDVAAVASAPAGATGQAVQALLALGYSQTEAASAVAAVDASLPVAEIIRLALRGMGGKR